MSDLVVIGKTDLTPGGNPLLAHRFWTGSDWRSQIISEEIAEEV